MKKEFINKKMKLVGFFRVTISSKTHYIQKNLRLKGSQESER